jgi:hypothetical protein
MQENEKPAKVRIENKMLHALDVSIPGPGKSTLGSVRIPKATPKDGPGVLETDKLDQLTLNRLRYHYEWRPTDPKNFGKKKHELSSDQIAEIGLLKITILKSDTDAPERKATKAA